MAVLLFRLNDVPADEADEVRELLAHHHIDCYETDAGRWGFSVAAIWLRDASQLTEARRLLDDYQHARAARVRGEYASLRSTGDHETLWRRFRREPLRFLFYTALVAAVIYFTLLPFVRRW